MTCRASRKFHQNQSCLADPVNWLLLLPRAKASQALLFNHFLVHPSASFMSVFSRRNNGSRCWVVCMLRSLNLTAANRDFGSMVPSSVHTDTTLHSAQL
eukprot:1641340-Amphidinium_carterae.1